MTNIVDFNKHFVKKNKVADKNKWVYQEDARFNMGPNRTMLSMVDQMNLITALQTNLLTQTVDISQSSLLDLTPLLTVVKNVLQDVVLPVGGFSVLVFTNPHQERVKKFAVAAQRTCPIGKAICVSQGLVVREDFFLQAYCEDLTEVPTGVDFDISQLNFQENVHSLLRSDTIRYMCQRMYCLAQINAGTCRFLSSSDNTQHAIMLSIPYTAVDCLVVTLRANFTLKK